MHSTRLILEVYRTHVMTGLVPWDSGRYFRLFVFQISE